MKPTLQWTLSRQGSSLHLEYTLANPGDRSIWVVDRLLVNSGTGLAEAPSAIIVRNGSRAGVASFYRGDLEIPTHDDQPAWAPGMREVAAGSSVTGTAEIALPLRAWHNYHPEKMPALAPGIAKAELDVQILPERGSEHVDWEYQALVDSSRVASPYPRQLREKGIIVSGGVKDIP